MLPQIASLEDRAKQILPKKIYDYIAQGAGDESTIANNRKAIEDIQLIPRTLTNVSNVKTNTQILNFKIPFPILIAPTAFHGLVSKDKEYATAQAAAQTNTIMIVSTSASANLESIAKSTTATLWFQLYAFKQKSITENLVKRAVQSGYKAIVLTVDTVYKGNRYRDIANNFSFPEDCKCENLANEHINSTFKVKSGSDVIDNTTMDLSNSLNWDDIKWLQSLCSLPIFLKGILHPLDAEKAVEYGLDGIIISNHGGRQLDSTIGTLTALPAIADVIKNRIPILIDGGFTSGTDIIKALALGADAILLGRPILWALALDGTSGVKSVITSLQDDLQLAMGLVGTPSIEYIHRYGHSLVHSMQLENKKIEMKLDALKLQLAQLIKSQDKTSQNKSGNKTIQNTNPYNSQWKL